MLALLAACGTNAPDGAIDDGATTADSHDADSTDVVDAIGAEAATDASQDIDGAVESPDASLDGTSLDGTSLDGTSLDGTSLDASSDSASLDSSPDVTQDSDSTSPSACAASADCP